MAAKSQNKFTTGRLTDSFILPFEDIPRPVFSKSKSNDAHR